MPRFASHSLLALVVLLAASGCGARAVTASASPVKAATACAPAERESRSEAECLREVLGDLAALDANEQPATRRRTALASNQR